MNKFKSVGNNQSPFHAGEQKMQSRVGKREAKEAIGLRVIRPFMPDQHRNFFMQLPFLVLGRVDANGWPWASLLSGQPGFTSSPDAKTLRVDVPSSPRDPALAPFASNEAIGVLGIELASRRRNRMNGRVVTQDNRGFAIGVDQSFGNCPQYIHKRAVDYAPETRRTDTNLSPERFNSLPQDAQFLIGAADTFFVSSFVQADAQPTIEGVDVSHRGGRPGFVTIQGEQLTVPDFPGNSHFNTLGNFLLNPKAGLVFVNFETGDHLQLTGTVELFDKVDEPGNSLFSDSSVTASSVTASSGAERGWRFTLKEGQWLRGALPFQFSEEP